MLSLPDFKEKQIVFIEADDAKKMSFRNDNLVISDGETVKYQVSCHKIFCVFILGDISFTTVLMRKALGYGISFIFMNYNFRTNFVIGSGTEGNTLLRRNQYSITDPLPVARKLVLNKIGNQVRLLKELRGKSEKIKSSIVQIESISKKVQSAADAQELLGYEGSASKQFFQAYFADFGWKARLPRTKYDPTNTLLDIGYTYLFNFLDSLLRLYGFDNYVGFYHTEFYQRKSLVCDLVEPFRCIVDKATRKAYNLNQVNEKDFYTKNKKYELKYEEAKKYTKIYMEAILERKEEVFSYIQAFYRCIMKSQFDSLPTFTI